MATESTEFGTGKTIFVLAIVVGCFAILWPKIFHPMIQGGSSTYDTGAPQSYRGKPVCIPCEIKFEIERNNQFYYEFCNLAIKRKEGSLRHQPPSLVFRLCKEVMANKCGVELNDDLVERFRKWNDTDYNEMLMNFTSCLKHEFNIERHNIIQVLLENRNITSKHVFPRQERPPHLRHNVMHPALREKGQNIAPGPRTIEKEARPGPMPGTRPTMGGPGHVGTGTSKQTSTMSIIMPVYTIAIVIFFIYTIMKIILKKPQDTTPKVQDFHLDPEQRKFIFAEEYTEADPYSIRDYMRKQHEKERAAQAKEELEKENAKIVIDAIEGIVKEIDQYKAQKAEAKKKDSSKVEETVDENILSVNHIQETDSEDNVQRHDLEKLSDIEATKQEDILNIFDETTEKQSVDIEAIKEIDATVKEEQILVEGEVDTQVIKQEENEFTVKEAQVDTEEDVAIILKEEPIDVEKEILDATAVEIENIEVALKEDLLDKEKEIFNAEVTKEDDGVEAATKEELINIDEKVADTKPDISTVSKEEEVETEDVEAILKEELIDAEKKILDATAVETESIEVTLKEDSLDKEKEILNAEVTKRDDGVETTTKEELIIIDEKVADTKPDVSVVLKEKEVEAEENTFDNKEVETDTFIKDRLVEVKEKEEEVELKIKEVIDDANKEAVYIVSKETDAVSTNLQQADIIAEKLSNVDDVVNKKDTEVEAEIIDKFVKEDVKEAELNAERQVEELPKVEKQTDEAVEKKVVEPEKSGVKEYIPTRTTTVDTAPHINGHDNRTEEITQTPNDIQEVPKKPTSQEVEVTIMGMESTPLGELEAESPEHDIIGGEDQSVTSYILDGSVASDMQLLVSEAQCEALSLEECHLNDSTEYDDISDPVIISGKMTLSFIEGNTMSSVSEVPDISLDPKTLDEEPSVYTEPDELPHDGPETMSEEDVLADIEKQIEELENAMKEVQHAAGIIKEEPKSESPKRKKVPEILKDEAKEVDDEISEYKSIRVENGEDEATESGGTEIEDLMLPEELLG